MIDSSDISEGMCAPGERARLHTCASGRSPAGVVRYVAHPGAPCARSASGGHLREQREAGEGESKENVRKENIQACCMFPPSASARRGTQSGERLPSRREK